jgi:hypothetical protein
MLAFVIVLGPGRPAHFFAATALVYNVMFSTSKVLSVTTGHIPMLGGVFGAYAISTLGLPWWMGLVAGVGVGALFGWLDRSGGDPPGARPQRRALVAAVDAGRGDDGSAGGGAVVGHRAQALPTAAAPGLSAPGWPTRSSGCRSCSRW